MKHQINLIILARSIALLLYISNFSYAEEDIPSTLKSDGTDTQFPEESIQTATVDAIDGTRIEMLVNSEGKTVTVASQDPQFKHRKKRKKHSALNGNPVDEPLSIGLINISSINFIEDAQPEISNPLP